MINWINIQVMINTVLSQLAEYIIFKFFAPPLLKWEVSKWKNIQKIAKSMKMKKNLPSLLLNL